MFTKRVKTAEEQTLQFVLLVYCLSLFFSFLLYYFQIFQSVLILVVLMQILIPAFSITYILYRCYSNKIGFKLAFELFCIKQKLKRELLDAHIYFDVNSQNHVKIVKLPKIQLYFIKDKLHISIENSIKFQSKLESLDISAALGRYIVDDFYMNDTQSQFIYELDAIDNDRRLIYHSLDAIKNNRHSDYCIAIDKELQFNICHALIAGATGMGKSYFLYYIVLVFLSRFSFENLYIIDPKSSSMAVIGRMIGNIAVTKQESLLLLREFHKKMEERKKEISPLLETGLEKDYTDFNLEPIFLLFDEYATFRSSIKTMSKAERDEIEEIIDTIILQGRQLGCFIMIAMQKSDATLLPTHIRNSLLLKIVLGQAENTTYITAFEHAQVPNRKLGTGEAFYTLQGKTTRPRYLKTPFLDFDIYQAVKSLCEDN
ncbi:hypothetical protein AB1I63_09735 [Streptococcus pneumoniae]